ncbi:MAG: Spy/CpxP family protein refolding chaperone, partial [Desulfobacteraceae bacterium]
MRRTVWESLRKPIFALSLGLNLAFGAVWLAHSPENPILPWRGVDTASAPDKVSSSLHSEIGVTEEQWERIEPLIQDLREKAGRQRREIGSLREQLMELLAAPDVDEAAIRSKQEEILAAQRRMQNMVVNHLLKEKEILSSEQSKKLIQSICKQCRRNGAVVSGKGVGRVLDKEAGVGELNADKGEVHLRKG